MGTSNYSDESKRDAVQQISVRGYPGLGGFAAIGGEFALALQVDEALRRTCPRGPTVDHEAENRRLKRELARVTEERDILRKATAHFERESQ